MDCFVERTAPRPTQAPHSPLESVAGMAAKMVGTIPAEDTIAPPLSSQALYSPEDTEAAHAKIALAVAQLLTPMITEAVDKAVQHSMEQLRQDINS